MKIFGSIPTVEHILPEKQFKKVWYSSSGGMLIFQATMLLSLILFSYAFELFSLSVRCVSNVMLDCFALAVLMLMYFSCMSSKGPDRVTVSFTSIIALNSVYVYLDGLSWLVDGKAELRTANLLINVLYDISVIGLAWLFWHFICAWIRNEQRIVVAYRSVINTLAAVSTLIILGNFFGGYFFTVSLQGVYSRSDTYALSILLPTAILIPCAILILRLKLRTRDKIIFLSYPLLPYVGALITAFTKGPAMTALLTFVSVFFVYSNLYIRREEQFVQKQAELAETKINSMLLQINPHFIYNTIGSVASLCIDDPEQARKMLFSFSDYLRNNFGEMAQKAMIPFEKEMEHLQSYIAIEKMRFPDITVEYDLKATDFELPSLSVQPLAENAITHGLGGRETGGTLKISSAEFETYYTVTIEDDGIGFENVPKNDGRHHLGIANVRNRLEMLCGGVLSVRSTPGKGTVSEIMIPKERN